ncbi:ATPase AAA [Shewanella sairae]|uniref:ATPase AAA n=1 Tax=Shewanella sairae TaxID=190310 RepID=A0ABQ4NZJ9_9GAMM|nr:AAA family ATPase [Shewanella sairae]MCL1129205.1 AAA family ATPase [Shewanella sairae]GIU40542.1 ATPase AAA [Shewanella sairae]
MSFSESTLLPSQDSLLQRLLHLSVYSDQLMVLTGEDGAGKTTLVTGLLNEFDHQSSALVICPKHCDSAEIRRKVLVQLLTEPVFDDEIPLPECLLSVAESLPNESYIVLDDAHLLPLEIWAECIILSQISFPGKSIKVLMTAPQHFFSEIIQQLPETLLEQVLAIDIEPLDQAEREGLYYTLLSRSEQQPFTPRDIVKNQLEMQKGTPQEVVSLLELALNGEPVAALKTTKLTKITFISIFCVLLLVFGWLLLGNNSQDTKPQEVKFAVDVSERFAEDSSFLFDYGKRTLKNHQYFPPHSQQQIQLLSEVNSKSLITTYKITQAATFDVKGKEPQVQATQHTTAKAEVTTQSRMLHNTAATVNPAKFALPDFGYTLQLASVKQLKSLNNMLLSLKETPDVKVARYNQRWVVLQGHFKSRQQALQQSTWLMTSMGISEPWVRSWKSLGEYELQEVPPTREIQ